MHTTCEISVSEDRRKAILTGKNKDLEVSLISDIPGEFSVMKAMPMETSPKNSEQDKNEEFVKLAFRTENVKDAEISILMRFTEKR